MTLLKLLGLAFRAVKQLEGMWHHQGSQDASAAPGLASASEKKSRPILARFRIHLQKRSVLAATQNKIPLSQLVLLSGILLAIALGGGLQL